MGDIFSEGFIDALVKRITQGVVESFPKPGVTQRYFTIEQAAEYMGVTVPAVRAYLKQGLMPTCAHGGKLRWIDKEDIDAFMRKIKR